MTIGQKLDEVMDWKGIHQKELSNATGISQSMISEYIRDVREPSLDALRKLAKALDVSLWVLINGDPLPATTYDVTEAEGKVLAKYRLLTGEEQQVINNTIRLFSQRRKRDGG